MPKMEMPKMEMPAMEMPSAVAEFQSLLAAQLDPNAPWNREEMALSVPLIFSLRGNGTVTYAERK